ncbi:MAG: hypothetical protein ACI9J3_002214 [Parvicellaceae bacterium]|jgi:hypothetical protein
MNKWIKFLIGVLFMCGLSALYFFRDFVFINANGQMKYLDMIQDNEYAHLIYNYTHSKMEAFLNGWTIEEINSFKWKLTFGFTVVFALCSAAGAWLIGNRKIAIYTVLFYCVTFGLAFIIYLFSVRASTEIVHFLHSPVPFLLSLAAIKLKAITENQND